MVVRYTELKFRPAVKFVDVMTMQCREAQKGEAEGTEGVIVTEQLACMQCRVIWQLT